MKQTLTTLLLLFLCSSPALSQVQILKKDSLSAKNRRLIESVQSNIFRDARTPQFYMTDRSEKFLFGIGGYVQAKGYYDFTGLKNSSLNANALPSVFDPSLPDQANLSAGGSLLKFELLGNTELGIIEANFETDFDNTSNYMRLRKAYIRLGGFLVGQDRSITTDMLGVPWVIDTDPVALSGYRLPMISYDFNIGKRWDVFISLEFPTLSYSEQAKEAFEYSEHRPDLNTKFVYKAPSGKYIGQLVTIARYLYMKPNAENQEYFNEYSGFNFGFASSHQMNFSKSSIYLQAIGGVGISDYISGTSDQNILSAYTPLGSKLDVRPLWEWGAILGYTYRWSEKSQSNIVASFLNIMDFYNYDSGSGIRDNQTNSLFSANINYLTELIPRLRIGGELSYASKRFLDTPSTHGLRTTLLFRYNF